MVKYFIKLVRIHLFRILAKNILSKKIKSFEPLLINIEEASKLIIESSNCTVRERGCKATNEHSKFTETVFLDEMANEMLK